MIKNYFFLARNCRELNELLKGAVIGEIYTQEKNRLFFNIANESLPNRHLVLSADQNMPFMLIRDSHHKARKNVICFFEDLYGAEITDVEIAFGERVCRIITSKGILYFMIRGNLTNIILQQNDKLFSFKESNVDEDIDYKTELLSLTFSHEFDFAFTANNIGQVSQDEVRKKYPFIAKLLLRELELQKSSSNAVTLGNIITRILEAPIRVEYNDHLGKTVLYPADFLTYPNKDYTQYNSFQEALKKYISTYIKYKNLSSSRNVVERYLSKEKARVANRLNSLKERIDSGSREQDYYKYGNLLLMNKASLYKGQDNVVLTDYETGIEQQIKLDEKLSVQQNIDRYFDKARNERINFERSIELFEATRITYDKLNAHLEKLQLYRNDPDKLEEMKKELKLNKNSNSMEREQEKLKLRHFMLDGKYHVYVGKDSQSNDRLSIKFAKQNDFWFHARGLPGSHTVLRVENTKEAVPKSILKNAASIAAFYSKAKTASLAPVSYTFAKFVYKKKGFNPGQVSLSKEQVLHVKPEIPKNAEIIEE